MNCCAASNRSRRRTMRFLKASERAPTQDIGGLFTQVGAVRRRACSSVFSIRIWRGASQAQDVPRCTSATGSGCVWSCFVLQKYAVEAGALQQVGLSRLIGLTFSGDLGLFLDSVDKILTELVEPVSEDLVSTIVVPQLREAFKAKTYHS